MKGELTAALPEITLNPPTAQNAAGSDHAVTAAVKAGGNAVEDQLVSFEVTAGPNTGEKSDPNTGDRKLRTG